ncbi:pre-mRNA-splicing factor [Plasmodium gonderi]|uniref:Pre-mRNA-splicing factor n=1 Tax=Plasmodium gonderi TaxID=77519 RepID=A0A1Y1JMX4_PLAGO|nr:pre-mRNA-splicing factor [Plasmodium gonderi]GAW83829.1 pre-mRNA-splicing factor [Plasmodium gonderi]
MDEYLRKKYMKKEAKKDKKCKKNNIKIYDSEENEKEAQSNIMNFNSDGENFLESESDRSSDIPITITEQNSMEIVNISKENKKKILENLNSELLTEKTVKKINKNKYDTNINKFIRENNNRHSQKNPKCGKTYTSSSKNSSCSEKASRDDNSYKNNSLQLDEKENGWCIPPHVGKCRSPHQTASPRKSYDYESDSDLSLPRKLRSGSESEYSLEEARSTKTRCGQMKRYSSRREPDGKVSKFIRKSEHDHNNDEDVYNEEEIGYIRSPRMIEKKNELFVTTSRDKKEKEVGSTIYRDKGGKIISREEWISKQKMDMHDKYGRGKKKEKENHDKGGEKRKKKEKGVSEKDSKKLEWESGLIQKEIQKKIMQENDKLINKRNIVNYDYDSDYDLELKNMQRKEDPMNIYLGQKEQASKATCRYQSPYNRFNILAGYRWDGVVRGNGFEKRRYEALKLKQHRDKMGYLNNLSEL